MVRKMKAIYHSLNLFNMDVTKKCLIGECWVPLSDVPFIRKTLADRGVSRNKYSLMANKIHIFSTIVAIRSTSALSSRIVFLSNI